MAATVVVTGTASVTALAPRVTPPGVERGQSRLTAGAAAASASPDRLVR